MDTTTLILVVIASYLIGSFSFARMVHKKMTGSAEIGTVDVKVAGTEHTYATKMTGASTMGMLHGEKVGGMLGMADMLKIFIPTLAFRFIFPGQPYFLYAAMAGMIGHIWPIYYKFVGGRGYSSIYGGLLAIDPIGAIVCSFTGLIVGIFVLKDFAVAYIGGIFLIIPYLWFRTHDVHYLIYGIGIFVIFMLALIPEITAAYKYKDQVDTNIRKVMGDWPMGRGILKMCDRLGIEIK